MTNLYPWLGLILRALIGGYFVFAAVPKIMEPLAFATSIAHYGIMPNWAVNGYALIVAWLELVAGIALVAGFRVRASSAICGVLLVMFTLAVAYAVVLGLKIDCGCFGSQGGDEVSWLKVTKNTAMIAMCAYLWWKPNTALSLDDGLPGKHA
ncbi:MAG: MauE/DoxX family redox-associated membrane protein [Ignavibacteria bacterium]|jgi:putative oxidoreductase